MNQELLAPPRLTVRKYARLVAIFCVLALSIGLPLTFWGLISGVDLAWRSASVAAFGLASVGSYSYLFRLAARARPERLPLFHAVIGTIGIVTLYATLGLMLRGTPFAGGVPSLAFLIPLIVGTILIGSGIARRVGDSRHCPRCEYEFAYQDEAKAPIRCPECGSGWLGLLRKGKRARSPRMMAAGIVIVFAGLLLGNPVFYMGPLAPRLATPLLYTSLSTSPRGMYEAWNELATRPLDEPWVRRMGERVIEQRSRSSFDPGPTGWFEAMILAGTMPQDLAARFYREGFLADLMAPRRATLGEPFEVHLRVRRATPGSKLSLGVMFAGYMLEDEPGIGRLNETQWAFRLSPSPFQRGRDVFSTTLTPHRRGNLRLRAVYWLVYQPSFMDELDWQPDGTPATPTAATWFERIELEQTIHVQ